MPRGVDRLYPGDAKIPYQVWCAERREKRAAGAIDMNGYIQTLFRLELVEGQSDCLHRLVLAGESNAQGGHHTNGVLVTAF